MDTVFRSILFDRPDDSVQAAAREQPGCFVDLNLDQVVDAVTAHRAEYDLAPFFHAPLRRLDAVAYRHEVLRDLDGAPLTGHVEHFAEQMRRMRAFLIRAGKLHYAYQQQRWFLDAVSAYCDGVQTLRHALSGTEMRSAGFIALRRYVAQYASSDTFRDLAKGTKALTEDLDRVQYCLLIKDRRIQVRRYNGEPDYSAQIEEEFAKFAQGTTDKHPTRFGELYEMNRVEAEVLDRVARLFPGQFAALERFCEVHRDFVDVTLATFDREVQFYLAYLELVDRLRATGLRFSYPQLSDVDKREDVRDTFDLLLADKLAADGTPTVTNDYALRGAERILVVTGPNQGGKTTFARAFGQVHHLAALGLPVPGSDARLFLPDRVFTHFERPEDLADLRGRLLDELIRIRDILATATSSSVVVLNEIFTSTTLDDALRLSTRILGHLAERDVLAVCVTFIDELASLGDYTVSMVAGVDPRDRTRRTLKIERKAADGRAYAAALAAKHRLTHQDLTELWSA